MLTKDDLKAIEEILARKIGPLDTKVSSLDTKVSSLDTKVSSLEKKMQRGFRKSHKTDNEILGFLDGEDHKIKVRVDRIERHLGLSSFA